MAIATLTIDINAKLANIERDMSRAAQVAEQRAKQIAEAWGVVGTAVGGALSGSALLAMVRNVADAGDAINDMATRTGLAVDELSRLNYAAGMSDVSADDLGSALGRLNKVLGEARDGSREAADALRRFGIDPQSGIGTLDAFRRIADAVAATGDQTRVASALNDVFGRSYQTLIPLLQEGSQGLSDLGEEAERMGAVMSKELAAASARFNDNLDRMGKLAEGARNQIGGELIPVLNELSSSLISVGADGGSAASSLGGALRTALESVTILGANVAYVFKQTGNELGGIAAQAAAIATGNFAQAAEIRRMMVADSEAARRALDAFEDRVLYAAEAARFAFGGRSRQGLVAYSKNVREIADNIDRAKGAAEAARDPLGDLMRRSLAQDERSVESMREKIEGLADPLKRYKDQLAEIERAVSQGVVTPEVGSNATIAVYDELDKMLERTNPRMRVLAEEAARFNQIMAGTESSQIAAMASDIQLLQDKFDAGVISAQQYAEAIQVISGQTKKLGEEKGSFELFSEQFQKQQGEAQLWANVMSTAFNKSADALTDFVFEGKGSMSDLATSVAKDISSMLIKFAMLEAVKYAASSMGYGFADGGVFDGGVQKFAKGGTFTNQIVSSPTLFRFAKGTGLMGEAGPEAIMPLTRGPDGSLGVRAQGAGGANVIINVVESPGRGGEVEREQTASGEQITILVERVKGEVANDISTGRGVVPEAMQRTYGLSRAYGGGR